MSIAEIAIMRAKCLELAEELDRRADNTTEEGYRIGQYGNLRHDAKIMRTAAAIFEREAN